MGITRIDHLYAETIHWEDRVRFWGDLGFVLDDQWGSDGHRAGHMTCNEAKLVLAEVTDEPAFSVVFDIADAAGPSDLPRIATPLSDTHWGTRWISVSDPDGRVHALEERSSS